MKCPYCRAENTDVINTRPTHHQTEIWRRRKCLECRQIFTTYEKIDLSFIKVVKKSGNKQRYSRAKLYSGVYGAFVSIKNKEIIVNNVTDIVESRILDTKQKVISSQTIAEITLEVLREENMTAFARFLAYQTDLKTPAQLLRDLKKYGIK